MSENGLVLFKTLVSGTSFKGFVSILGKAPCAALSLIFSTASPAPVTDWVVPAFFSDSKAAFLAGK